MAKPNDLPSVQICADRAYAPYIPLIGKKPAPMCADFGEHVARSELWVTSINAHVAAFIVFYPKGDRMLLENVAVHPDAMGLGLGRSLIAFCEAAARRAGKMRVELYTNAKMAANLCIYPHLGYRETARRKEDGFDRVYFEKRL